MTVLRVLLLLVALAFLGAATPGGVTVQPAEPVIARHSYSAAQPPPELKTLTPDELGLCATQFGCNAQFRTEWIERENQPVVATITAVVVEPHLQIDIWTAFGSGSAVLAHEETHRLISEHYYAQAASVARRLAAPLIGRKITLPARSARTLDFKAMARVKSDFIAAFMAETSARCKDAQARFDAITDHARKPVSNVAAMRQAIAEEEAHRASRPRQP